MLKRFKKGFILLKKNQRLVFSLFTWGVIAKIVIFRIKTLATPTNWLRHGKLIVHAGHHKAMTVYFDNAFRLIAFAFNLKYQNCKQTELSADTNIFLEEHSHINISELPNFVGTHIVRDPRDIIVSGYFYHKWCKETWTKENNANIVSYQDQLNALSQDEGLMLEIKRVSNVSMCDLRNWNYRDQRFLELKYEDLIIPSGSTSYSCIFSHLGFEGAERALCVEIMRLLSFQNRTGREVGQLADKSHFRSGQPGQWKIYLNESHKQYIKKYFGDVVVKLGYESNDCW